MNKRLEQIFSEQKNIPITKDMFELWLQNDVTRIFLLDIEGTLIDSQSRAVSLDAIENIAINEIKRVIECRTLEKVLEWNPITDSE